MKKLIIILIIFIFPMNVLAFNDTAKSTIVMDMDSGRILYQKNAHEKRLIASITKIMTAIIAIENGKLTDEVTVGKEVLSMYGSNIYLEMDEKMTLENLLYGLMLRSGNDAAIVIAYHIANDESKFVEMMNQKAKEIGMTDTIFSNCHGLDENTQNYSTAYDMALLSSYAMKNKKYREIVSTKKRTVSNDKKTYIWNNRNKLLSLYKYSTGGKTGYTPKAGRTLVTTASKDNLNLTTVTLSDNNEYETHQSLYEHYFNRYSNYLLIDKNDFDIPNNYFKEELYVKKSFSYPLRLDECDDIHIVINLYKNIDKKDNQIIGEINVLLDNDNIYKDNIYMKNNKKNPSIFKKFLRSIKIFK